MRATHSFPWEPAMVRVRISSGADWIDYSFRVTTTNYPLALTVASLLI